MAHGGRDARVTAPSTPGPAWTLMWSATQKPEKQQEAQSQTESPAGAGLKHPPARVRANPGRRPGEPGFPGPSAKATLNPKGRIWMGPQPMPPASQAPHEGTLCGVPRLRDDQPGPASSWALQPSSPYRPQHCTPPPPCPGQCRPVSFPAGVATPASTPASPTAGRPSNPHPTLQTQQNLLEPNPGTWRSLPPLRGLLGPQDEATHPPTTPSLLQRSDFGALSPPRGITTPPVGLPTSALLPDSGPLNGNTVSPISPSP